MKQEQYIKECEEKYPNHFDFSKIEYISKRKTPIIKLKCLITNQDFDIRSGDFKNRGCPICNERNMREERKTTLSEFIERSEKFHGKGRFGYQNVKYIDANTTVQLYDYLFQKSFEQTPSNHYTHKPFHERDFNFSKLYVKNDTFFLQKVLEVFGPYVFENYVYRNAVYRGMNKDITIECVKHGNFTLKAKHHVHNKSGCPACGREKTKAALSGTKEQFIEDAILVHGDNFIYDEFVYINNRKKVLDYL